MAKYEEMSKEHFNRTAGTYESGCEGRMAAALYESVLKKLDGSDCRSVLDVGCGPGTVLSRIAAMNKGIALSGIDLSPEMARIARERLGEKVEIRLCNICSEQLPYDENSFDRVICMSTFHHLPNPNKALAEMYRVIKPEGSVIIADVTSFFPLRQLYNLVFCPLSKKGDVRFYSESEFRRLFEECRFQSVKWEKLPNFVSIYLGLLGFVVTAKPSK